MGGRGPAGTRSCVWSWRLGQEWGWQPAKLGGGGSLRLRNKTEQVPGRGEQGQRGGSRGLRTRVCA